MNEPECTWLEHPIRKIYGTFTKQYNFVVERKKLRKKLKGAEELSNINSGTEIEENLKKSRKIRAAKVIDKSKQSFDDEINNVNVSIQQRDATSSSLINSKQKQLFDDDCNENVPIRLGKKTSNRLINEQDTMHNYISSENFQHFVIQKLINLELKINSIKRYQKLILQKIPMETFQ
ncbi:hypothetical protein ACFW04_013067 [Cataglyphis niger]